LVLLNCLIGKQLQQEQPMSHRIALCLALVMTAFSATLPATAQPAKPTSFSTGRTSLGLNFSRADYFYARSMLSPHWGAEVGVLEIPRLLPSQPGTQGVNLSMVGRAPLGQGLGIYGKVGAIQGLGPGGGGLGMRAVGPGLSFGAGVSWDFSPRLSATLAWDSHDLRFAGAGREPVRSTSIGLQYRY
jgi:hypothetical protein